ncbi:MAG: cupin domain-containing protein [Clostridiales Family XIII bacterium]|jgi:quercetin dioxygenase-like cupin family protein|nr:cupin domain-containing protein [Clostridiales Family XIII bacterium]
MTKLVTHERDGRRVPREGRTITWIQKPQDGPLGPHHSSVCTVVFEPGGRANPGHTHLKGEETAYVISGHGRVRVGNEYFDLEPGSLVFFPQGVPHIMWNNGNEALHIVCFYAPKRESIEVLDDESFDHPEFL